MKQKFYDIRPLLKNNAEYNILFGERSNGKSYQVKNVCLKEAYEEKDYITGEEKTRCKFAYLRRWREDITASKILLYFSDINISEITEGKYSTLSVYRGVIYFANIEDEKEKRGKVAGYTFCLTGATHYKSLAFPDIGNINYEEFCTEKGYLGGEVASLYDIVSTIARRDKIRVMMVGNSISRINPYFREWSLRGIYTQKQGTIEIYNKYTNQIDDLGNQVNVKIAVEYCENSGKNSKMFFGANSGMITNGSWTVEEVPHLIGEYTDYKKIYSIYYKYGDFIFWIELLKNKKSHEPCVYVYPAGKNVNNDRKNAKRVVADDFCTKKNTTFYLTPLGKFDKIIIELIKEEKICFDDNLTGTEFRQIKKERGGY